VSTGGRKAYEGFVYLLACRWLHTPGDPAPFAHDFAAAWCGVTARQAKDARLELVRLRMLEEKGKVGQVKLWLPRGVSVDA
jgi:hypothetical protein